MGYIDLTFEKQDHVATITLNRPQALNAISQGMMDSFFEVYQELDRDDDVRVAIFTGAGRGFCAGIDLKLTDLSDATQSRPVVHMADQWIAKLMAVTKPTIAAVNGVAAGGGLGLTLGCDIRIASEAARFSAIFANIGMTPLDGVGWLLPRQVGHSKALEMIYTADIISAKEAERIGLVNYVVPPDQLMTRAREMAERIAAGPPVALQLAKSLVYGSLHKSYVDFLPQQFYAVMVNRAVARHDIQEGTQAFKEKRTPKFRGYAPP